MGHLGYTAASGYLNINQGVAGKVLFCCCCIWLFATHGLQHARLSCLSPSPGVYPNSCPSSWWCHPTISSSVIPISSHLQSFPASGSFPMSQFFASGGQSIAASASASILPMNIQGWFPLGWTGQISLLSKGLLRVFSSTTVQNFSGWTLTNSYPTELNPCHPYISKIAFHQKSQIGGLWVAEGSYSFGLTSTYWVRDVKK